MIGIKGIIRTAQVDRWQIVRTSRNQTMAEHSYMVTMIALQIALDFELPKHIVADIAGWALVHDTPETITGDVSTPAKKMMGFDDTGLIPIYDKIKGEVTGSIAKNIVKIADLMEALMFLNTEGVGNHAASVKTGIMIDLNLLVTECRETYPVWNWEIVNVMIREGSDV
jgi:5'-deoxynucleotidase